ncbi:MAG: hypothetical protein WCY19_01710 [Candidatus Gastranaerophilaceae bacterium]
MKRFGILIFIFMFWLLGVKCIAQSQFSASLTTMEKSLFGVDYSTQSDDARLKRLEEVVYGQASSSPVAQRVGKLSADLSADLIGQEIKPKKDTFAEEEDIYGEKPPKADSSVNYPIVNTLEKAVFNKEFKTADINQRLANLEQNVFKKTYNDDLNSRVERLKSALMRENPADTAEPAQEDEYSDVSGDDIITQNLPPQQGYFGTPSYTQPSYNSHNSVLDEYDSNSDLDISLGALEKSVLKRTFPNDTIPNRLSRLELKVFKSTFADDDEQTRLDRVASAYQAKKTSTKYDGNTFSQHMSAAMQIGAILLMVLAAVL